MSHYLPSSSFTCSSSSSPSSDPLQAFLLLFPSSSAYLPTLLLRPLPPPPPLPLPLPTPLPTGCLPTLLYVLFPLLFFYPLLLLHKPSSSSLTHSSTYRLPSHSSYTASSSLPPLLSPPTPSICPHLFSLPLPPHRHPSFECSLSAILRRPAPFLCTRPVSRRCAFYFRRCITCKTAVKKSGIFSSIESRGGRGRQGGCKRRACEVVVCSGETGGSLPAYPVTAAQ